ncbi:hypothetical protein [Paenibacillus sp. FSL M8-0142]|uniref:hypothetical protein n=1 Tax=Paenibacillus sp. FSL M8-0142 TaxID=2954525 RepID=UPI00315A2617
MLKLLGLLDRQLFSTGEACNQDPLFEGMLDIVQKRCGESQFTIGKLAGQLNVSTGYVQRMFRRYLRRNVSSVFAKCQGGPSTSMPTCFERLRHFKQNAGA